MPNEFEKDPIVGTLNTISRTAEKYPQLPTLTRVATAVVLFACAGSTLYVTLSDEIQASQQVAVPTPVVTPETPSIPETRRQMEVHAPSPLFRVIDLAQWQVAPIGQGRLEIILDNNRTARVDLVVTDIPNSSMDILQMEYPELAMTLSEPVPNGVDTLQIMIDMLPMPGNWQNFDPETQEMYREDAKRFLNANLYSVLEGDLGRRPVDFDQIFKELGNGQRPYMLEVLFPTPGD